MAHALLDRYPRAALAIIALAIALAWVGPASASPPTQDEALTLRASPAFGGVYRPGAWLPIVVDLQNDGIDRSVEVRAGSRSGAQFATRVDLPNSSRKSVVIYVYLPTPTRSITVRVMADGAELRAADVRLKPDDPRAILVGLLAGPSGPARPPNRLPNTTPLSAIALAPGDLPGQALGLSSLDALVIDGFPTADLRPEQVAAVHDWVLRGGQLIVAGGDGAAVALSGLPQALRPVEVRAATAVAAAQILGADAPAADLPLSPYTPAVDAAGRAPYALPLEESIPERSTPLAVEQRVGQGSVTFVALPLGHPALAAWPGMPALWASIIHRPGVLAPGVAPQDISYDAFIEGSMASTLINVPMLSFPPLNALGLLLLAYIVIVGPGAFLLLRRIDRLSLGWAVVPLITMVFAGLAYGLGYARRGGDIVVNQVTLIEPVEGEPELARVRSFAGIFSPAQRSYSLQARPLAGDGGASLLRPISVQGPWDTIGAGGGVFIQGPAGEGQAEGFDVAKWSMRALAADTIGPYGGLESQVTIDGQALRGEVVNRSGQTFRDVALVQGDRVARFGDLGPGERRAGELVRTQAGGGFGSGAPLSYIIYAREMDANSKMGGAPLAAELQLRTRILDALFSYGPQQRSGQPLLLAWSDEPALDLAPSGQRADRQHVGLLLDEPRVEVEAGSLSLDQGWLSASFESGPSNVCFGGQGAGVVMGGDPAVMRLALPRDLYGLRADKVTLLNSSDSPWSEDTSVELYDWAAAQWERQPAKGRPLEIGDPGRFLSPQGTMRVRLDSGSVGQGGCIYIDAKLKGTLP